MLTRDWCLFLALFFFPLFQYAHLQLVPLSRMRVRTTLSTLPPLPGKSVDLVFARFGGIAQENGGKDSAGEDDACGVRGEVGLENAGDGVKGMAVVASKREMIHVRLVRVARQELMRRLEQREMTRRLEALVATVQVPACTCTKARAHTHTYARARTHTHTHTDARVRAHIHTHASAGVRWRASTHTQTRRAHTRTRTPIDRHTTRLCLDVGGFVTSGGQRRRWR